MTIPKRKNSKGNLLGPQVGPNGARVRLEPCHVDPQTFKMMKLMRSYGVAQGRILDSWAEHARTCPGWKLAFPTPKGMPDTPKAVETP